MKNPIGFFPTHGIKGEVGGEESDNRNSAVIWQDGRVIYFLFFKVINSDEIDDKRVIDRLALNFL